MINQKCNHHEHRENNTQILLAKAEVMFKMITLVFKSIEGFIFDLPSRTTASHQLVCIVLFYDKISHPTEMLCFFRCNFPIFQKVNQYILVRGVERYMVKESEAMRFFRILFVDQFEFSNATIYPRLFDMIK